MIVTRDFSGALGRGARIDRVGGMSTRDGAVAARAPMVAHPAGIAQLHVTGESMREAFGCPQLAKALELAARS